MARAVTLSHSHPIPHLNVMCHEPFIHTMILSYERKVSACLWLIYIWTHELTFEVCAITLPYECRQNMTMNNIHIDSRTHTDIDSRTHNEVCALTLSYECRQNMTKNNVYLIYILIHELTFDVCAMTLSYECRQNMTMNNIHIDSRTHNEVCATTLSYECRQNMTMNNIRHDVFMRAMTHSYTYVP